MKFVEQKPTGGGWKNYYECTACGNTGFVTQTKNPDVT